MQDAHIISVEWGCLVGRCPRPAGCNARLGPHGDEVRLRLVRLTADDGMLGCGAGCPSPTLASAVLGTRIGDLFAPDQGVRAPWRPLEYAVWDLVGTRRGQPVYALAAALTGIPAPQPYQCAVTTLSTTSSATA